MKQLGTIFRFEFKNYAKSKSFLILTVLLVVIIGVVLDLPRIQQFIGSRSKPAPAEMETVAVVDKTGSGRIAASLSAAIRDKKF
ncbi:MAG: hypothetical protein LKJ59_07805, partial [Oscillospiraceae bacterium]|nr:hypothetical protein [Oscillospiraceae bacterium]